MKCPKCSCGSTYVLETRAGSGGAETKRRRQCNQCGHKFTTYEISDKKKKQLYDLRKYHRKFDAFVKANPPMDMDTSHDV